MAVTLPTEEAELRDPEAAFRGSESAILVDYKGLNVPQVTELRRQLRTAKASYKVVKNTLAQTRAHRDTASSRWRSSSSARRRSPTPASIRSRWPRR